MRVSPHFRRQKGRQAGYVLAVIMVMLLLALLAMTAAVPYVITQIKRDREDELIHRGRSYSNAVKRYFKKFGRYPATLKDLQNTNNMRFIRKLYSDPMSKTGEWRVIHMGEAKYFPKGFGYTIVSGQSGGTGGALLPGGMGNIVGMGGSTPTTGSQSSGPGQPAQGDQSNQPNTSGMTPADQISKPLGTGSATFGGGPIIGVASTNKDLSIHEVNERKHYNEWEFFYDPRYEIAAQMLGPANQAVSPGLGQGQNPGSKR